MISVIVPVYNMEKYLARCVDSLLSQTMKDFEILLIDDGSTDGSASICKEYAARDNRIRYIKKKNGGLSDARNVALEHAKGEFVTFIDSDDFVHGTYLEYLLSLILENNADISSCIHFETSLDKFSEDLGNSDTFCMSGYEACERMLKDLAPVLTAACGKLYRTSTNFLMEDYMKMLRQHLNIFLIVPKLFIAIRNYMRIISIQIVLCTRLAIKRLMTNYGQCPNVHYI